MTFEDALGDFTSHPPDRMGRGLQNASVAERECAPGDSGTGCSGSPQSHPTRKTKLAELAHRAPRRRHLLSIANPAPARGGDRQRDRRRIAAHGTGRC
jgi:hypothetical protein